LLKILLWQDATCQLKPHPGQMSSSGVKNFYCGDCVTKNEDINKQNAKRAYIEQHSPNFTLAQASGHINSTQKPTKKSSSSS
jgi:hypothetical protein